MIENFDKVIKFVRKCLNDRRMYHAPDCLINEESVHVGPYILNRSGKITLIGEMKSDPLSSFCIDLPHNYTADEMIRFLQNVKVEGHFPGLENDISDEYLSWKPTKAQLKGYPEDMIPDGDD